MYFGCLSSLELMEGRARAFLLWLLPPFSGCRRAAAEEPGPILAAGPPSPLATASTSSGCGLAAGPVPILVDGPSPLDAPRFQERLCPRVRAFVAASRGFAWCIFFFLSQRLPESTLAAEGLPDVISAAFRRCSA